MPDLILRVTLLWLAGCALRFVILAAPPVIPAIHADLSLSATQVGILGGLPMVLFAVAALPGSLLISRFGAVTTLVLGLLLAAIGGALRGVYPSVAVLYGATIVMGLGVAIMQPSLPPLVRAWLPHRIGFGTAVFTNGLLVGEIAPVSLMIPLVLPLVGGSWPWGLAVWSVPTLAVAAVVLALAPRNPPGEVRAKPRWWPDWRDGLIWRLGIVFGSVNAMYFGANIFLPDYLDAKGRHDLISAALTGLNVGQLPASFLLLAVAGQLERRVFPYIVGGVLCFASILGIASTASAWTVMWASILGFAAGGTLVLALAVPPLLCAAGDVARVTAAVFAISYSCAVLISIVAGTVWDVTRLPVAAFVPIGACALLLMAVAPTIPFGRRSEVDAG